MPKRRIHFFVWLIVLFTLLITLLSFWVVGRSSVRPMGQGFMISDVSVSVDFERHQFLTGTVSRFPYGARQVCVRFNYSRLADGAPIDVIWAWDEKRVQADTYEVPAPSGTRMYCLLKEDGSPLPRGKYTVEIRSRAESMPKFHFEIY